jgi:putative N6-adenine-specific DNA methylase
MIAKNVAPGILRSFAFERFPFADSIPLEEERQICRQSEKREKTHDIAGSDSDAEMIKMAIENARAVGLSDSIVFEVAEFSSKRLPQKGTLVTNPPYGERISDSESAKRAHEELFSAFRELPELSGGIITGLENVEPMAEGLGMKNRKIPNGPIPCRYYFRTSPRG